jgi:hypothetical protein
MRNSQYFRKLERNFNLIGTKDSFRLYTHSGRFSKAEISAVACP